MMESVGNGESKLSPSAAGKKLKQTRLPFQLLTGSPTATPATLSSGGESRKRKISSEPPVDGIRATKIGRTTEAKENVKDVVEAVTVVVDLSEESNGSDLVDVRKENQKLVAVKVAESSRTPTKREDGAESSGLSGKKSAGKEKGDKFMIKLPVGKKKDKKVEDGTTKKVVKEKKKKHKRDSKVSQEESDDKADVAEEPVVIDDSDEEKQEADKTEETSKKKSSEKNKKNRSEDTQNNDKSIVVETETVEEKKINSETAKLENESSTDEQEKNAQVNKEEDKHNDDEENKSSVSAQSEDIENEKKATLDEGNVTPRRGRSSRIAAQKTVTETNGTPKLDKSAKKAKKGAESTDSQKETDVPKDDASDEKPSSPDEVVPEKQDVKKSAKGALDKFFAKVGNEKPANQIPKVIVEGEKSEQETIAEKEAPKTPEKVVNGSIVSICLDDSADDNGIDDEENAYMLCTPNTKERSLLADKKLTPKQIARQKEAERKQALKQQELEEKKRKKQEEKEAKQREKDEQELQKKKEKEEKEEQKRKEKEEKEEQKRKEKEEKEEQKRKEKEEKEKKRLAEIEAKNEEKRKKDEQKEEERKKKEEEKEAEEKRKQKTAQAFQSFFVKKATGKEVKHSDDENSMEQQQFGEGGETVKPQMFMPFCVKGDMRLAPVCRVTLADDRKQRLDEMLKETSDENGNLAKTITDLKELYLGQLKEKNYVVGKSGRMWAAQDEEGDDDDVMIVDDNVCHKIEANPAATPGKLYRAKFFLFEENRRPPYRGTWRKQSSTIKPRRPFVQDSKFFDYEVDSDEEWEEEEPGESLHGSDDEKDVDPEEDYEVDNDFFVPHGHLSDEELQAEDDIMDDNSPEAQKAKLKIMQQEFAAEMKKKTQKIKPRLIGCLWENTSTDGTQRSECSPLIWEILKARAMMFDPDEPISLTAQSNDPESNQTTPSKDEKPVERKFKQVKLVDEGVKELITLIHGCAHNRKFLIKEFLAYWAKRRDEGELYAPQFAPDSIRTKILEISSWRPCPDEGLMQNKMCWYVNKDTLKKYDLADLTVPTGWKFILKPIVKSKKERKDKEVAPEGDDEEKKSPSEKGSVKNKETKKERSVPTTDSTSKPPKTPATNITKFTKKLSEDDKRKQLTNRKNSVPVAASSTSSSKPAKTPKRKSTSSASNATTASGSSTSSAKKQPDEKQPAQKKRVALLMSVPRGQEINQTTKSNLISKFLAKPAASDRQKAAKPEAMEVDPPNGRLDEDVIVLDD